MPTFQCVWNIFPNHIPCEIPYPTQHLNLNWKGHFFPSLIIIYSNKVQNNTIPSGRFCVFACLSAHFFQAISLQKEEEEEWKQKRYAKIKVWPIKSDISVDRLSWYLNCVRGTFIMLHGSHKHTHTHTPKPRWMNFEGFWSDEMESLLKRNVRHQLHACIHELKCTPD